LKWWRFVRRAASKWTCVALLLAIALPAAADEPTYDGYQELIDYEARLAMDKGDYKRAETLFWRLVQLDPRDARALREAGRTAYALGDFSYAERALAQVDRMRGGAADPEIHYLRAQALLAQGREAEAQKEMTRAEQELAPHPPDRISLLWLARIYALRGDLAQAKALYETLLGDDPKSPAHGEIMTYIVEAHIFAKDWRGAERMLRELLLDQPDNQQARELLVWTLEARGKIDEELRLREALAQDWRDKPRRVLAFARALERAQDYPRALAQYREAQSYGAGDLSLEIRRLHNRLSPEVGAAMVVMGDPAGTSLGWMAGVTVPIVRGLRVAASATHDRAEIDSLMPLRGSMTAANLAGILSLRGWDVAAGATLRVIGSRPGIGGQSALRTPPGRLFQLQLQVDAQMPWREASTTIQQGGVVDAATLQLYARPFGERVVLGVAGQGRRLGLAPDGSMTTPHAKQLFGALGLDYVLWSRPTRQVRGEIFDETMLWPTTLATSLMLSYRHYELVGDDPFGLRLVLVDRSQVDEASATFRWVVDSAGALGVELRAGAGNDWARDVRLWRGGASLLLSVAAATRLTGSFDVASQTGTGLPGVRHTGWISFHVDL